MSSYTEIDRSFIRFGFYKSAYTKLFTKLSGRKQIRRITCYAARNWN